MPESRTKKIIFNQIWAGKTPSQYFGGEGEYLSGIGIDPDLPISDAVGNRQSSGQIRPSGYAAFDGAPIDGNVIAIIPNPKNALVYVVMSNGTIISYSSVLGSETEVGTVTGSNAEGAWYYNNHIIITGTGASKDDVSMYGPLDNSPAIINNAWKGSKLGTQTALVDTTYPSLRGSGTYPNHWGYVHTDNRAYFCDFKDGQGFIHFIKTSKGTDEGDTDDGSQYNALNLPFGFMPMSIGLAPGGDMAIVGIMTNDSTLNQGKAMMLFWDGSAPTFYRPIVLPDSLVTAVLNNNGELLIWSGSVSNGTDVSNGYRVSKYAVGQSIQQLHYSETGVPPMQGAVEAIGNRVFWGTFEQIPTTTGASPEYYAVVMALGSKRTDVPQGVHGIIKATASGSAADGLVTAIKNVQQASFAYPKFIVAWRDSGAFGLDKQSTTYGTWIIRFFSPNMNRGFLIKRIRFSLAQAVAANMIITGTIFLDDFSASSTNGLTVINNTNYSASQRIMDWYPGIAGNHNFVFELRGTGTALLVPLLPIEIDVEVFL